MLTCNAIHTVTYHPGENFPTELKVEEVAGIDRGIGAGSVQAIGGLEQSILRIHQFLDEQVEELPV